MLCSHEIFMKPPELEEPPESRAALPAIPLLCHTRS